MPSKETKPLTVEPHLRGRMLGVYLGAKAEPAWTSVAFS